MNKDNAHLYLPLVQALAEGKTIQYANKNYPNTGWKTLDDFTLAGDPDCYRIKPEPKTAWYRVAETTYGPTTANNEADEHALTRNGFKRWLTDRIHYEVTE